MEKLQDVIKRNEKNLFYIISLSEFFYSCGVTHRIFRKSEKDGSIQLDRHGWKGVDYHRSAYRFTTAEDALACVKELQAQGVLNPNTPIRVDDTAHYGERFQVISIIKRPIEHIIGGYFLKALELQESENIDIPAPRINVGDIVYLTFIEDGDPIIKTKVYDMEWNDHEKQWYCRTSYWFDYPYKESRVLTQSEFNEQFTTKREYSTDYAINKGGHRFRVSDRT